ncbi:MAG: putative porin [Planctomycetota bacterium]
MRAESILDQPNGEDRHRGRVRFRVGAWMKVAEDLSAEVRLSTSSGHPDSANWDLGGGADGTTTGGAQVVIDRVQMKWQADEALTLQAGKMGNPFHVNPLFDEWLWDDDIQFSGIAGTWAFASDIDARAGYFVLDENNAPGDAVDPAVAVLQVGGHTPAASGQLTWSTALWNWTSESPADYQVWDTMLAFKRDEWSMSLQYFENLNADSEGTGLAASVQYGQGGRAGDGQLFLHWSDFEANASDWSLATDDIPITVGPDGREAWIAGYRYWWHDNTTLKFYALQGDDGTDDLCACASICR